LFNVYKYVYIGEVDVTIYLLPGIYWLEIGLELRLGYRPSYYTEYSVVYSIVYSKYHIHSTVTGTTPAHGPHTPQIYRTIQ